MASWLKYMLGKDDRTDDKVAKTSDGGNAEGTQQIFTAGRQSASLSTGVGKVGGYKPTCRILRKGLRLWVGDRVKEFDVAEAPYTVLRSDDQRYPLDKKYKFSEYKCEVPHVRCLYLTHGDDVTQLLDEMYEVSVAVVAVIFVNVSNSLFLSEAFHAPDYQTHIPLYVLSSEDGDAISKDIDSITYCRIMLEHAETVEMMDTDIPITISDRTLCDYLASMLFPVNAPPVIISDSKEVFKEITVAFAEPRFLQGEQLIFAVRLLTDNIESVVRQDFLFYFHLTGYLKHYFIDFPKFKLEAKLFLAKFYDLFEHLETKYILESVSNFYDRGNFGLTGPYDKRKVISTNAFYNIHTYIQDRLNDKIQSLKKKKRQDILQYFRNAMVYATIILKFRDFSDKLDPRQTWHYCLVEVLQDFILSPSIMAELDNGLLLGHMLKLPKNSTFIGSGAFRSVIWRDGKPLKFSEYELAISSLAKFIDSESELLQYLDEIFCCHIGTCSSTDSVMDKYMILEGFHFLNHVFQISREKEFVHFELQIILKKWMAFLFNFVKLPHSEHVAVLKKVAYESKPLLQFEIYQDFFKTEIQKLIVLAKFTDVMEFINVSDSLPSIVSPEIIHAFFTKYKLTCLDSKECTIALEAYAQRFPGALKHQFLIESIIKPASLVYAKENRALQFLVDVTACNVKHFLGGSSCEDRRVQQKFQAFLSTYCRDCIISQKIPEIFAISKVKDSLQLSDYCNCTKLVLEVLSKEILSSCPLSPLSGSYADLILFVVSSLAHSLEEAIEKPSVEPYCLYWHLVNGVCLKLVGDVGCDSTDCDDDVCYTWVIKYGAILLMLSRINSTRQACSNFDSIKDKPETKHYVAMMDCLKRVLQSLREKYTQQLMTYEELDVYAARVHGVAEAYNLTSYIHREEDIRAAMETFRGCHVGLSKLLIRHTVCSEAVNDVLLYDMFDAYNIEFSTDLIEKIRECTFAPSDLPPESAQIQAIPAEKANRQMLGLKKKTTLHELQALLLDMRHVLYPVECYLPIFDHCHLLSSQLFLAYMRECLPQSGTATIGMLRKALIDVQNAFGTLLKGTATRQSLLFRAIANVENIREEVEKLTSYREFSMYSNSIVMEHIENALIVPEVINGVKSLLAFCNTFQIDKSMQSEHYRCLQRVCEKLDEATIQHMTLEGATEIINEIKKILGSDQSLGYLPVIKDLSDKLIQVERLFIGNKFTAKGESHRKFQQNYQLVTQKLQQSAEGLKKLQAILNLLSPLNNPAELSLFDVLAIFSKLDEANFDNIFTIIMSDIDFIKAWFFRAEDGTSKNKELQQSVVEEIVIGSPTLPCNEKLKDHLQISDASLQAKLQHAEEKLKEAEAKYKELEAKYFQSKQESDAELQRIVEEHKIAHKESEAKLQKNIEHFESHVEHSWNVSYKQVCSEKEIGRGGYGTVSIGQLKVAVKQLHHMIMSPEMIELMHREIKIMTKLCHPNLLQFVAAVFDHPSGNPLIITELMDMSLRDAYEKKLLTSTGEKLVILKDVAAGLSYLHCLPDPIIHRDVSSGNVLLEAKGRGQWVAKISDFGSAKLAKYAVTQAPGASIYSAPEALQAVSLTTSQIKAQTTKMDVFSFGILLCEIMTEKLPITREKFYSMLQEIVETSPLVHNLISQCITVDSKQRPSMSAIIEILEQIILLHD